MTTVIRPRASVVIVHRNQGERCATTIRRFAAEPDVDQIFVVDNASDDSELGHFGELPVELIQAGSNTGFGPGLNIGLRRWLRTCTDDWVVLSPHDALIEPGGISRLIDLAHQQVRAGIICADVGDQATPHIDPWLGAIPGPAHQHHGWEPAHYPHGTLIVARRDCLAEIGLFDERYFAYNDEADLGLRAIAAGWEVGLARGVVVENPTTSTAAPVIDYLRLRNTILLLGTHYGPWHGVVRAVHAVVNVVHARLRPSIKPPWYDESARLWGVIDAARRRWGGPRQSTSTRT